MGITYIPQKTSITFTGGEITVRGLSLPDVSKIVDVNRDLCTQIYDQLVGRAPNELPEGVDLSDTSSLMSILLTLAPNVALTAIAIAADAEDQFDLIATLPIDVQVETLVKIGELTFAMEGGSPKKFLGNVVQILQGATSLASRP